MAINRWVLLSATVIFLIYFVIIIGWGTFINRIRQFNLTSSSSNTNTTFRRQQTQFTLNCFNENMTTNCSKDYYLAKSEQYQDYYSSAASTCPEYFKWIHEDLKPWKSTGITREMVERGQNLSSFRLVILQGKAYFEKYENSFKTRDVFTIWGILQLLRLYPGNIQDLELLFQTGDVTVVDKQHFQGPQAMSPPPVFHYCGKKSAFDIVFPDWSFWGWAEIGIRPWEAIMQKIQEGNKKIKWKDRIPYAFWKGNTGTPQTNMNRMLDWSEAITQGFRKTKLEDQCIHRYKIYAEGVAWSVSDKYILACDSMTLFMEPNYYDFFTRSMVPMKHYWPISIKNMCKEIEYAVDWGNTNADLAEEIGKIGSSFIEEKLKMKFVYDYMLHLLNEYAKLLRFQPTIPAGAVEICSETVACPMDGLWRQYMIESMVKSPSDTPPCTILTSKNDKDKGDEQY